jgi:glycerol kinase
MRHVLAIDEGTTGVTCLVVAEDGHVLGRGYREITQYYPQPGWVEHDADEIVRHTIDAARDAMRDADVTPDAVGITNQRETVVVWDRESGRPLHRAIVWQDRRTADRCAELAPRADFLSARTGLVVDPYFSATKLEWLLTRGRLLEGRPPERLAAGTIDSWLIWQLTGRAVHATDPTNASRTLLYDIDAMQWSDELCSLFGVPAPMLPEVRPSSGHFGVTDGAVLGAEIPVLGVAGDQQAALYGQGCWLNGEGKNTYGTGAFLLMNTGRQRPRSGPGLLTTVACDASGGPAYALEGAIFIAGAAVQWLRDALGIIDEASETEELARSLESNDGVYFVPALVGLGAPNWEPRARGMIVGLTRGAGRAHLARAALEAMAYSTHDVLDLMSVCAKTRFERLRVDGGATANDWLLQFQADVLGVPVVVAQVAETTALGAAFLAGVGVGRWTQGRVRELWRARATFEPAMSEDERAERRGRWSRAVECARSFGEG